MKRYLLLLVLIGLIVFPSIRAQAEVPREHLEEAVTRSAVIIIQTDSTVDFGNSVIVAPNLIVTAAHVVKVPGTISISWMGTDNRVHEVYEEDIIRLDISREDSLDIAFIKINPWEPIADMTIAIDDTVNLSDNCFLFTRLHDLPALYLETYVASVFQLLHYLFILEMPALFGISGSGVYNTQGELMGIVSGGFKRDSAEFTVVIPIFAFQKDLDNVLFPEKK